MLLNLQWGCALINPWQVEASKVENAEHCSLATQRNRVSAVSAVATAARSLLLVDTTQHH